jgi:hypothetical protein
MLTYHPIHDIHHCAFRLLSILMDVNKEQIEWERLQIMDFYYVFPHLISTIRLPRERGFNKSIANISKPYVNMPDSNRLMFELMAIQAETGRGLAAKSIFDREKYIYGKVMLNQHRLTTELMGLINSNPIRAESWYYPTIKMLVSLPLDGDNGLKARTKLMEYKYDAKEE